MTTTTRTHRILAAAAAFVGGGVLLGVLTLADPASAEPQQPAPGNAARVEPLKPAPAANAPARSDDKPSRKKPHGPGAALKKVMPIVEMGGY